MGYGSEGFQTFGESHRRLNDMAEERMFDPEKETPDKYCF